MSVPPVLAGTADREAVYLELTSSLQAFGPFDIEEKKTCIHLAVNGRAFLGVHPRKTGLRLTIPLDREIADPRIVKTERASKNRVHNDLDLAPGDLDKTITSWIHEAYQFRKG